MTTPATERTGDVQQTAAVDAAASGDRAAIEQDIERTREQLGETVDALSSRLDVKTRMKDNVAARSHQVRQTMANRSHQVRQTMATGSDKVKDHVPLTTAAAVALVASVVGLALWRRRR